MADTDPNPRPPASAETIPAPPTGELAAWWVWMSIQAGVLTALATGVRPTAGYPEPVELTAGPAMAVVQLITAGLLGPALLGRPGPRLRAMAAAVVFAGLAGRLGSVSIVQGGTVLLSTLLWLNAFNGLTRWRPGRLLTHFATVGLPLVCYAGLEYAHRPWPTTGVAVWASPTLGILTTGPHLCPWERVCPPIAVLIVLTLSAKCTSLRPISPRSPSDKDDLTIV